MERQNKHSHNKFDERAKMEMEMWTFFNVLKDRHFWNVPLNIQPAVNKAPKKTLSQHRQGKENSKHLQPQLALAPVEQWGYLKQ